MVVREVLAKVPKLPALTAHGTNIWTLGALASIDRRDPNELDAATHLLTELPDASLSKLRDAIAQPWDSAMCQIRCLATRDQERPLPEVRPPPAEALSAEGLQQPPPPITAWDGSTLLPRKIWRCEQCSVGTRVWCKQGICHICHLHGCTYRAPDKFSQHEQWSTGKGIQARERATEHATRQHETIGQKSMRAGQWKCYECGNLNPTHQQGCANCETPGIGEADMQTVRGVTRSSVEERWEFKT